MINILSTYYFTILKNEVYNSTKRLFQYNTDFGEIVEGLTMA